MTRFIIVLFYLIVVTILSVTCRTQKTELDSQENIRTWQNIRAFFSKINTLPGRSEKILENARNSRRLQDRVPDYVPFPCDVKGGRSPVVPNSVHKLRPGDIDLIGSLGDSLTAGFGIFATKIVELLTENRGVSATGGGQGSWREYLTIPNILKEFNPNLIGYAVSDSLSFQSGSKFNIAESGAISGDMPFMTEQLIRRIKNDSRVDIEKHWKLISLMIGANDFCSEMCYLPSPWSIVKNHREDLLETLRIIRDNLPRTLVNIIPPPHLKTLFDIKNKPPICEITNSFSCPCIFGLRWRNQHDVFYKIMTRFQNIEEEIAQYTEFQRNDFAVIVQPFTTNLSFPIGKDGNFDLSYLSADCFHISQKANARCTNAIWNNMFLPPDEKIRDWDDLFKNFACPTAKRPFIATWQNSQRNYY